MTLRALEIGHPEELLGAALCVGAVLAAAGGRSLAAAVLLGLAVATKAWAVLAIGPVLLALPAETRLRACVVSGGVCGAVLTPLLLGGSAATLVTGASTTGEIFQPQHLFWALGSVDGPVIGGDGLAKAAGWRTPPGWLSPLTHPAIALLVVPLSLLWARRRPGVRGEDLLLLLALLLLLHCVLDPWNVSYYALPFLTALLAWEALTQERPPVITLAASAATWVSFDELPGLVGPDALCALYLLWALPLTVWMARRCFAARSPALTSGLAWSHAREVRLPVSVLRRGSGSRDPAQP